MIIGLLLGLVLIIVIFSIVWAVLVQIGTIRSQAFLFPSWIWGLVGLFFLLLLLSWILRLIFGGPWRHGPWQEARAERILKRRYARGEISREQYKRMMKDIRESD